MSTFAMKTIYLLITLVFEVNCKFYAGRIKPGKFEYPALNGWMLIGEAKKKCDEDLACGGFTFKGSYKTKDLPMEVYFFHVVPDPFQNDEITLWKFLSRYKHLPVRFIDHSKISGKKYFYWSTYEVKRTYIVIPNVSVQPKYSKEVNERKGNLKDGTNHVARHLGTTQTYSKIDFSDFKTSNHPNDKIMINLQMKNKISHTFPKIDRCCKPKGKTLKYDGIDNMDRIFCNITKEDFKKDYIDRRKPVVLLGCQENWKAKHWSFKGLINRFDNMKWPASYYFKEKGSCLAKKFDKNQLLNLLNNKAKMKMFARIPKYLKGKMNEGRDDYHLVDLLDEYDFPAPFPEDMFDVLDFQTDQAYLMLATTKSGTGLHIDPLFTDAFNALIKGKKWWVVIPRDLYEFPEHFTCLKTCSGESDSINFFYDVKLWYQHMLPQLRNRVFYGQNIKTFLQQPGETIYMPHVILHSVWNTTPNVAIGDNPLFESSFVELVGSGGYSESSEEIRNVVESKTTGDVRKRLQDVKNQIHEAIIQNNILTYTKSLLWHGSKDICYNEI